MAISHTDLYKGYKGKIITQIKKPLDLVFWTQTAGKRLELIKAMTEIQELIKIYKDQKTGIEEKNKAVKSLKNEFKKVFNLAKFNNQYIEFRLIFMHTEDLLIENGIDPIQLDKSLNSLVDEEV